MEEPLGTDSQWTISKWSSECWLLLEHKKCFVLLWVLFVSLYTTAIISPQLLGSFYRWVEKRFGCYQQEQFNLHWENSVFDKSQCTINNRKFKMRWPRESKKSNSLTRQNNNCLCMCITLFCTFFCRHCTTTTWKCLISRFVRDKNKQW